MSFLVVTGNGSPTFRGDTKTKESLNKKTTQFLISRQLW